MNPSRTCNSLIAALVCSVAAIAAPARAGDVEVVNATARCHERVCRFEVTLKHADEGWEHYADRWQVISPAGEVLGTRVLYHPHEQEQPFTRSLSGVRIPSGINEVLIRARDSVHGEAEPRFRLQIR